MPSENFADFKNARLSKILSKSPFHLKFAVFIGFRKDLKSMKITNTDFIQTNSKLQYIWKAK